MLLRSSFRKNKRDIVGLNLRERRFSLSYKFFGDIGPLFDHLVSADGYYFLLGFGGPNIG